MPIWSLLNFLSANMLFICWSSAPVPFLLFTDVYFQNFISQTLLGGFLLGSARSPKERLRRAIPSQLLTCKAWFQHGPGLWRGNSGLGFVVPDLYRTPQQHSGEGASDNSAALGVLAFPQITNTCVVSSFPLCSFRPFNTNN